MSDTPTFWTNDDGYILVDDNGAPYFGTSCPCGAVCWQRYSASCIDNEGSDVYGNSGTGKISEGHWDIPMMTEWKCGGTAPTNLGVLNRWVQDAPGFAHIWTSVNLGDGVTNSSCKEVCSVSRNVAQPDLPCSCAPLWSSASAVVRLPNYSYYVCKWKFTGWQTNANGGSVAVSEAVMPMWEYDSFVARGTYDKITGSRYTATRSFRFLTNFVTGMQDGPQNYCGSDEAQWSSNRSEAEHGTYYYYSVRGVDGANGYYVQLPNESIFAHRNGSNAWIDENEHLFMVSSLYKDPDTGQSTTSCCVSQIDFGTIFRLSSVYSRCCSLGFTTSFNNEQFGHLSVAVNNPETHIHPFIVREARGAQVPRQDIDVEVQPFVTGRYEGSPLWYYRTYATTDWDYPHVNNDNWEYALSLTGDVVSSLAGTVTAPGVFCPEYWFLYITQAWQACTVDSNPRGLPFLDPGMACLPGVECMPPMYMENTAPDGRPNPPPYWLNYSSTVTGVGWTHEVDESLDQNGNPLPVPGLRSYASSTDEHAYMVSRLSIKNYPTWYGSDVKCATSLNGALWEIPQMDMSDSAWFRRRGCYPEGKSSWPDVYDSRPYTSCSCAYYGIGSVLPQEVLMNGRQPNWYIRTIMFDHFCMEESSLVDDSLAGSYYNTYVVFPTSYIAQYGSGCPENRWSAVMFWTAAEWGQCCVTSGGATQWVDIPRKESLYVSTGYCGYDNRCDWGLPAGEFTWQGNIPDSDSYCPNHTANNISVFRILESDWVNYPDSDTMEGGSISEPALWVFEYTTSTCDPAECDVNISRIAKYVIKTGDAELIVDKDHCPVLCDPFQEGDVITVIASCSMSWSKTLEGKYERTIPNGYGSGIIEVLLPDVTATPEITEGGTIDLDFEWRSKVTLQYSAEYTGEGTITWSEALGYNFLVNLNNVYITQTWVTEVDEYKYCSYTVSENVSSQTFIDPDDPTYSWTHSWGGRVYKDEHWSSNFTRPTTTSTVSSFYGPEGSYVDVTVSRNDYGLCQLNAGFLAFGGQPVQPSPVQEGKVPDLPPQDWYNWSQVWRPAEGPFYITNQFDVNFSAYQDSNGSYSGSMYWQTYSNNSDTSNTTSVLFANYAFGVPTFHDMDCTYTWWSRPEILYPCNFKGRDVLDYAPNMALSSNNAGDSDYAAYSAYNSGDCEGRWSSTTDTPKYGVTETVYQEYNWFWEAEWNESAGINPNLVVGGNE